MDPGLSGMDEVFLFVVLLVLSLYEAYWLYAIWKIYVVFVLCICSIVSSLYSSDMMCFSLGLCCVRGKLDRCVSLCSVDISPFPYIIL